MSQIDQGNSDGPCWLRAPHELCDVLRAGIPRSSERVLAAVQAEIPEYHQPVSDEFGDELRAGVIAAIERFVDLIESGGNDALGPSRSLYYDLGRHELRSGRRLETLLGAYQIGARVAWQELVAACTRAEAEPELVYALAAAIFAYVQELSTASAQGYAAEQAAVAGATRAARHELVALLTSGGGHDPSTVQTAASRAGWPLPKRIAAVVCRATEPDVLAARLGPRVIWAAVEGFICLLIPEPDEDLHAQLVESLHDMNAAVGPVTTLNQAATGWRWAYRAQTLIDRGIVGLSGVVITDDHLTTLLLHSDEELLAALRRRWLAPIEATPARSRQGMADTLLAWLSRHGNIHAAAADLHVHPHTVRYRLEKLRHLYGDALDDPDARLELQLALRAAGVSVASATQALSQASSAPV